MSTDMVPLKQADVIAPWGSVVAQLFWDPERWVGRLRYTTGNLAGTVLELSEPAAKAVLTAFKQDQGCSFRYRETTGTRWAGSPDFSQYRATQRPG